LGTVQFGLDYGIANTKGQPNQQIVNEIIQYVYENDINCFDTAQAYGNSEEVLGKAIDNKNNLYVVSKLKSEVLINRLNNSISKSLNYLNINSLYGLLLHDSKLLYSWKDKYSILINNLIKEKKIKYFGVSIYTNKDFELALNNNSIKLIQIPFNIFDQRAIHNDWLAKAKAKNKLIFIRSIFLQGLFFMDTNDLPSSFEKSKQYLIKFNQYCEKLYMTKSELALSFVNTLAKDSILLFGCDNLNQAQENIKNYNALEKLDKKTIENIINDFKNISEDIYNPTKW
jgi:aryl-alcohol dehydrogenase-like predicted oxidoreductase